MVVIFWKLGGKKQPQMNAAKESWQKNYNKYLLSVDTGSNHFMNNVETG